ncbi:MAG: nuclear transport factor 2 family protein [Pyrinomonadaceae bacterium]|nr:nuclear transport factor 2 family protein [Pyrinomonadaceae bacterium]
MEEKEPITSVNHSTKTEPIDAERTVATPHFDAAAVRQARPAVPLAEIRARRTWPVALIVLAVLAGLAGGVIGGILSTGYLRRDNSQPAVQQAAEQASATTTDDVANKAVAAPAVSEASQKEQMSVSTAPGTLVERGAKESAGDELMRRAEEGNLRTGASRETDAALRAALSEWVAATNARDLSRQLSFYRPTMNAFYRRRNASVEEVRADRARVFERADSIRVQADSPSIQVSPDGQTATMRFRKRYSIAGGGEDRSGEVVQELRWQRIDGKWRITSERDLRVVN